MKAYLQEVAAVLAALDTGKDGLSAAEAAKRLQEYGPNRLQEGKKTPLPLRFLQEMADPMILILLAAARAGESFADGFIILAVVVINAALGLAQERKAEKTIKALREITAATSRVLSLCGQALMQLSRRIPGGANRKTAPGATPVQPDAPFHPAGRISAECDPAFPAWEDQRARGSRP